MDNLSIIDVNVEDVFVCVICSFEIFGIRFREDKVLDFVQVEDLVVNG